MTSNMMQRRRMEVANAEARDGMDEALVVVSSGQALWL